MTDPRSLTRQEFAEFLPNQRAIKAFEKLFDLVPSEFENTSQLAEEALILAAAAKAESARLSKQIELLQIEIAVRQNINLSHLTKRVEILETLEG